jgi:hypothetical protein
LARFGRRGVTQIAPRSAEFASWIASGAVSLPGTAPDERTVMTTVTEAARRTASRARHSHLSAVAVALVGLAAGVAAAPYLLG